jgi:hypothetical protein
LVPRPPVPKPNRASDPCEENGVWRYLPNGCHSVELFTYVEGECLRALIEQPLRA